MLVEYKQECFLHIVLEVSKLGPSPHVCYHEKPYGDPLDLEKECIVWKDVTQIYEAPSQATHDSGQERMETCLENLRTI